MGIGSRLSAIACLSAAISACASAPPDLQAEKAALMQVSRDWAQAAASGDVGYLVERNQFTLKDDSGTLLTLHGKSATVWRKDANGAWKCVIDIGNDNPPQPAAAGAGTG
jgi:ketosteroid isomerase-like protein